jgi:[pyruvate, water dikinase]-phosphate phosphotransferase / [pyruvate, water dikinase] kinase
MPKPVIYVVSDSAGETGTSVVQAAVVQFSPAEVDIRRKPFVTDTQELDRIIEQASKDGGMIVYTIVVPELREYVSTMCAAAGVMHIDLLGPIMNSLQQLLHKQSRNQPGRLHLLDEDYFRRVEAIEFAVKFDDGRDPTGIILSDLVLVGVSRTSKTPLSMYLAHHKFKVANVPLVPELILPEQLFKVNPRKIVGLIIDPEKLNAIRRERLKALGLSDDALYASDERIRLELQHSRMVMEQLGCVVIDVSNRAVEETAGIIINQFS